MRLNADDPFLNIICVALKKPVMESDSTLAVWLIAFLAFWLTVLGVMLVYMNRGGKKKVVQEAPNAVQVIVHPVFSLGVKQAWSFLGD